MINNEDYMRQLFSKYLSGQCAVNELDILFKYLATSEGKVLLNEVLDEESAAAFDIQAKLDPLVSIRILNDIHDSIVIESSPETKVVPLLKRPLLWKVAVSILFFFFAAGFGLKYFLQSEQIIVTTGGTQKRSLFLPDGSRVILNFNSKLTYNESWSGEENREVVLEGEAFFDVVHDEAHPFYVNTQRMEIKVLGTAFNVKSDALSQAFETTLIRGKVTVRDLENPSARAVMLLPNEQAVFSKKQKQLETTKVKPDEASYWRRGKLVFEDEPVEVIVRELEKWYHVKIELDPSTGNCPFNLNVNQETLPEILSLFEAVTGVQSVITGKNVVIKGKLCDENVN